jgi:F-type H+-transporting ATPase subunit epsilon
MTIRCEIASQDRLVFEGDADIVVLPGTAGEMGILPHHTPLLTTLKMGVIKVRLGGKTVLADAAENIDEIDIARAEAARERAKQLLEEGPPAEDMDRYLAIEAALRRSNLRLEAIQRYRSGRSRLPQFEERGEE